MKKEVVVFLVLLFGGLIYFYSFAVFLGKNFLWVLPVFIYLIFFVVRESKYKREELEERLAPIKGRMKFDYLFLF